MTPELKETLLRYYATQEQESIDIKHKIYNRDMQSYLRGERKEVRFEDDYASYIYIDGDVFNGWKQAADYVGVDFQVLKRSYFTGDNPYKIRMIKTTDKPLKR